MTIFVRRRAACGIPRYHARRTPIQSENKNKPGDVEFHDRGHVLLPRFHGGTARRIVQHGLARRSAGRASISLSDDEKPASNDLGNIRPPGGVPLFPSGAAITVQAGDAATKRLEAAPAKDLDKWVAELERLTGKKPEGWA